MYKFKALNNDKKWEYGFLNEKEESFYIGDVLVDENTICENTSLKDIDGKYIYTNDYTMIKVDGYERKFKVSIKTVKREVISHPIFYDDTAKVNITGVVFEWDGYDLFPCVDTNGVPDNEKMKIIGNHFD